MTTIVCLKSFFPFPISYNSNSFPLQNNKLVSTIVVVIVVTIPLPFAGKGNRVEMTNWARFMAFVIEWKRILNLNLILNAQVEKLV